MKNLSKLTKKVITDKRGHRKTVWVKTDKETPSKKTKGKDKDSSKFKIPVFDEKFEKVYKKYMDKDYFGAKEQADNKVRSWKDFLKRGSEEAKKYTEQDVRNSVLAGNKERAHNYTYKKLKDAIDKNDKDYLKSVLRHDQNFTKDLYHIITGNKVPSTTKSMIEFIDKQ